MKVTQFFSKGISKPVAIAIIAIFIFLAFGGVLGYKIWQSEKTGEILPTTKLPQAEQSKLFTEEMNVYETTSFQENQLATTAMTYGKVDLSKAGKIQIGDKLLRINPFQTRCVIKENHNQQYEATCPIFSDLASSDNAWVEYTSIDCGESEKNCISGSNFRVKGPNNQLFDTQEIDFEYSSEYNRLRVEEVSFSDQTFILISGGMQGMQSGGKHYFLYSIKPNKTVEKINDWECAWGHDDFQGCKVASLQYDGNVYFIAIEDQEGIIYSFNKDSGFERLGPGDGVFIKENVLYFIKSNELCSGVGVSYSGGSCGCLVEGCVSGYYSLDDKRRLQKSDGLFFKQEHINSANGYDKLLESIKKQGEDWISPLISRTLNLIFAGNTEEAWTSFDKDFIDFQNRYYIPCDCEEQNTEKLFGLQNVKQKIQKVLENK